MQLATQTTASDGTVVNLWVEPTERGPARVSDALLGRMRDKFAAPGGIYDMLVQVGGPLWGEHDRGSLLPGSGQPVDIFFVNFERDGNAYGLVGYFWA